jgi:hypothetical protein
MSPSSALYIGGQLNMRERTSERLAKEHDGTWVSSDGLEAARFKSTRRTTTFSHPPPTARAVRSVSPWSVACLAATYLSLTRLIVDTSPSTYDPPTRHGRPVRSALYLVRVYLPTLSTRNTSTHLHVHRPRKDAHTVIVTGTFDNVRAPLQDPAPRAYPLRSGRRPSSLRRARTGSRRPCACPGTRPSRSSTSSTAAG